MGKWTPAMDREDLETVLHKVRAWRPFDAEALLDDVGAALDDVLPADEDVDELVQRLRGHSIQLVDIAVAAEADQKDQEARELIVKARTVRSEEMPGDYRSAVGHLRRMAWSVNELLERLVAIQCVKQAA